MAKGTYPVWEEEAIAIYSESISKLHQPASHYGMSYA